MILTMLAEHDVEADVLLYKNVVYTLTSGALIVTHHSLRFQRPMPMPIQRTTNQKPTLIFFILTPF